MSYILDALKRADAERERGVVPGLYARQLTSPISQAASGARRRLWLAIVATLALAAIAAGLWLSPAPIGAPRQTAPEPAVVRLATPAPVTQPTALPIPLPESALVPPPVVPPQPAVAMAPVAAKAAPAIPLSPLPPPLAKASAAVAAAVAVPLLSELSEEIRRQIPALSITGAVYSENPGQRLLLVNNQVLPQGSVAAPDVTLEEIGVRSSVLSFRGTKFRLAH